MRRGEHGEMKYIIGFIFGISTACAFAGTYETLPSPSRSILSEAVLMAAMNPGGHPAVIKVDDDGHVICSGSEK